jgi:myo-inositol-1(or 4)-monophosphatase
MSLPNSTHNKLLEVALNAASKASGVARQHRETLGVKVSFKGDRNLVTTADVACEKIIVETILSAFPEHKILAEESAQTLSPEEYGKGTVWVIDPIDGTTNYAHGHFNVGISIGCAIDGITQVGVVAAPFLGEVFAATKGGGAFCNGARISISGTSALSDALITTGFPYRRENSANICARIERVIRQCRDLRRLGAASLDMCWVACGRLDAYFEETLQPWDGCAGGLIAKEAGAALDHYAYDSDLQRLTERYPGDLFVDNIIVASPELMPELKAVLDASRGDR